MRKIPTAGQWLVILPLSVYLIVLFLNSAQSAAGENPPLIFVNEVMASNSAVIADEDGDYEDWIELYNGGATAVNLTGYGLSDSYGQPFRWLFPAVIIEPGEFLLIWASGKNRANLNGPLHTNFSISAAGEEVLLTDPDGQLIDEMPPTPIPANISLGRQPDGDNLWFFFDQPTPGSGNITPGYSEILTPPTFSQAGGFYSGEVAIALNAPNADAVIHYTLDGSVPTEQSPIYNGPIVVGSRDGELNELANIRTTLEEDFWQAPQSELFKGNIIRARAFRAGSLTSSTATRSYFIHPDGNNRYSLPIVSLTTDAANFFDPDIGIYIPGNGYNGANWLTANYAQRGRAWERPVHIEFYEADGTLAFAQDGGVRIHGNWSRRFHYKSIRFYARTEYGANQFAYALFPERPFNSYSRFMLRTSGQDTFLSLFRDGLIHQLTDHLPLGTQAYRPTVVFLNGEYWGIHNLRERQDENFLAQHYGVDPDQVVMREGYNNGDAHYQALLTYIAAYGATAPSHYNYIQTQMDVENFIDYNVAEIYSGNHEWPWTNVRFWRLPTAQYEPDAPYGHDGRWRWLLVDVDKGFGYGYDLSVLYYQRNTLRWATNPDGNGYGEHTTFLLRSLLQNHNFRNDFINRFADQMNTALSPERVLYEVDAARQTLYPEISEHIARHGQPSSFDLWNSYTQIMRDYATHRATYQREHIVNHFDLSGTAVLTLNVNDPAQGAIQINSIVIDEETVGVNGPAYPWQGVYFQDIPIQITPIAKPGYRFAGWVGPHATASPESGISGYQPDNYGLIITLNGNLALTARFEPDDNFLPMPHLLANGPYTFSEWDSEEPAGTYPTNMIFEQTNTLDPGLNAEMDSHWELPYNLPSRSRVAGLGEAGVGFVNTGNAQELPGAGFLGTGVLGLNSLGQYNLQLSWVGGTVVPNNREYGLRLQYRPGSYGPFYDLLDDNGQPIEYLRHETAGHETTFTIDLPSSLANKRYIQLRWRYYYTGVGDSGARAMLRLDDIVISSEPMPTIYLPAILRDR